MQSLLGEASTQTARPCAWSPFCRPCTRRSETAVLAKKGKGYNVQIEARDDDNMDYTMREFSQKIKLTNVLYEARRRQYHENHQDFLKRKAQEKGRSKMREARERFLETYADAHRAAAPPPAFGDMFFYDEQNADDDFIDFAPPQGQQNANGRGGGGRGGGRMNNGRAGSGRGGGRGGRSNDARASYQASSQANGARQTGPGSKREAGSNGAAQAEKVPVTAQS